MKKLSAKALSVQLSIVIIGGLLLISIYSISTSYHKHIDASQEGVMQKLHSITTTLSASIDGDKHQKVVNRYSKKDEIKSVDQDSLFNDIHQLIRKVQLNIIYLRIFTHCFLALEKISYVLQLCLEKVHISDMNINLIHK